jgi:uncharacterized protein YbjT (DUF2867 family)
MKVLLFGGTGMVGDGVLHECLADPRVTSVLVRLSRPFFPLLKRVAPKHVTTAENIGRAMIAVSIGR